MIFYSLKTRGYVTLLHLQVLNVLYLPLLGESYSLYSLLHSMRDFRKGEPVAITNLSEKLELSLDQLSMTFSRLAQLIHHFMKNTKNLMNIRLNYLPQKTPLLLVKTNLYAFTHQ